MGAAHFTAVLVSANMGLNNGLGDYRILECAKSLIQPPWCCVPFCRWRVTEGGGVLLTQSCENSFVSVVNFWV